MKRKDKKQNKSIKRLAIVALCGVTLAAALGFCVLTYYFAPRRTDTQTVTVPRLVGKLWSDVNEGDGFDIIPEYEYSDELARGKIAAQSPPPNSIRRVKSGSRLEVKVTVSLGKKTNKIPKTTGMPYVQAAISLREIGADVVVMPIFDTEEKAGTVISTEPPENAEIRDGDRVVMYVARGRVKASVMVPSLVGMSVDEACIELLGVGLKLGEIKDESGNAAQSGKITAQSLREGIYVKDGTRIDLVVGGDDGEQTENNGDREGDKPWWHFGLW